MLKYFEKLCTTKMSSPKRKAVAASPVGEAVVDLVDDQLAAALPHEAGDRLQCGIVDQCSGRVGR